MKGQGHKQPGHYVQLLADLVELHKIFLLPKLFLYDILLR
jgi:hypothetical protein